MNQRQQNKPSAVDASRRSAHDEPNLKLFIDSQTVSAVLGVCYLGTPSEPVDERRRHDPVRHVVYGWCLTALLSLAWLTALIPGQARAQGGVNTGTVGGPPGGEYDRQVGRSQEFAPRQLEGLEFDNGPLGQLNDARVIHFATHARFANNPLRNGIIILYNSGSIHLNDADREKLRRTSLVLNAPENANRRVVISGYADAVGSQQVNQQLSLARAEAVANFLAEQGVDSSRLQTKGYGAVAVPSKAQANPGDRRVELTIMPEADPKR